jgi:uncharacterized protein (DUF1778 family)
MATPTNNPKTARFEARITEEQKALFLQAAALGGHNTLTDFIITSAQEKAAALVKEYEVLQLSRKDRQIFIDALLNPPAPSERLRQAAQHYLNATD